MSFCSRNLFVVALKPKDRQLEELLLELLDMEFVPPRFTSTGVAWGKELLNAHFSDPNAAAAEELTEEDRGFVGKNYSRLDFRMLFLEITSSRQKKRGRLSWIG